MKKVFVYVGHSNWGKSMALKSLTEDNFNKRNIDISNQSIKVKKMSNDDDGTSLLNFVREIPNAKHNNFIIAFCPHVPTIKDKKGKRNSLEIINELKVSSKLFFFVQKEKYKDPKTQITENEINWLSNYGKVYILEGQNEAEIRAERLKRYIEDNI